MVGHPLQEHLEDAPYRNRLLLIDHQVPVWAFVIAEESLVGNGHLAVCKTFPLAPGAVFRNAPALFLGKAAHDGNQQLTLSVEGPNVLFLEIHLDSFILQLADGGQAIDCIPGEAADRLRHDQINLAVQGISNHLSEAFTAFCAGAGNALVGIHLYEFPVLPGLNEPGVVVDLSLIARELLIVIR